MKSTLTQRFRDTIDWASWLIDFATREGSIGYVPVTGILVRLTHVRGTHWTLLVEEHGRPAMGESQVYATRENLLRALGGILLGLLIVHGQDMKGPEIASDVYQEIPPDQRKPIPIRITWFGPHVGVSRTSDNVQLARHEHMGVGSAESWAVIKSVLNASFGDQWQVVEDRREHADPHPHPGSFNDFEPGRDEHPDDHDAPPAPGG